MYSRSALSTRLFQLFVFAGALVLGATCRLSAASYYVDYSAGSDTNTGTGPTTAWRHCPGDPTAAGTASATTLAAGDTVFFKGGVAYVLTGAAGIILRSSGTASAPITFDGNSSGTWGTGKARLTDNNGGNGIAAFSAAGTVSYLAFKAIEFGAIGGSASAPTDLGNAVPARYGAALMFNAGVTNTTVDSCAFHDLGYWYNQKPMSAASIAGTGIGLTSCNTLTISNCDFYHLGTAIEMATATSLANLTITNCTFHDSVCWTIDLPPPPVAPTNFAISGCTETNNAQLSPVSWAGYGPSPRTDLESATAGATVTLTVASAASPAASYQWQKNGTPISGATNNTLTLFAVTTADSATYTAVATNSAGTAVSNDAILTVNGGTTTSVPPPVTTQPTPPTSTSPAPSPAPTPSPTPTTVVPVFTSQPNGQTITAGASVTFTAAATGTPMPSYQWLHNGFAIAGQTQPTLTIAPVSASDAGSYIVRASNSAGTITSNAAQLTVTAAAEVSELANLSVRGVAGTGANTLMIGFVVDGSTPKSLLIRGVGPTLRTFSVTGTLSDPELSLFSGSSLVATNHNWSSSADAAQIASTSAAVGAFALPNGSGDSALVPTVAPGAYTAQIGSATSNSGVALIELYDALTTPGSHLVNASVRTTVSASNAPIIGFVVKGSSSKKLLIRAVGPGLQTFSVDGALSDPKLDIFQNGSLVQSNDNWGGDATLTDAFKSVGAFPLTNPQSADAAMILDAAPGEYSAVISGVNGAQGVVLVEIYELP